MPNVIHTAARGRLLAATLAALTSLLSLGADELRAQAPPEFGGVDVGRTATITAADMQRRVGVLAHDSMGGRDTPSTGLTMAATYIAREFESMGLKPAIGTDYFQWYPLTAIEPGAVSRQSLTLSQAGEEHRLDPSRDFVALPVGPNAKASGSLSRASGSDAEGKVLVILATSQTLGDQLGRLREELAGGAMGALIALDAPERYVQGVRMFFGRSRLSVGEPDVLDMPVAIVPLGSLPGPLARAIEHGEALDGWSADLRSSAMVQVDSAMNVVAWLEGSDPDLRNEYVVFTAHMDHVGVGGPVNGDSIFNGADDDASGTAGIIELAQAFATGARPRRSLVFMTVSGEEKGLLGSEWYSEHPLFPLEKTVANINMDMIGRNWTDTIVAIGKEESSLGPAVERIAADNPGLGLAVIDDIWPEERFYFRSDHYNFARNGVPILFFFSGVHPDYHRPSDEADKLDYEKAARIVQLVYLLGLDVANADGTPAWNPEAYRRVVEGADD
jgi:hypothetical protein